MVSSLLALVQDSTDTLAAIDWTQLGFRWIHFVAGVVWIGILYFFNWINGHVVGTLNPDEKKTYVTQLMPRALYWFRMGALLTWITGVLLMFLLYYHGGGNLLASGVKKAEFMEWFPAFACLFVGFLVYDQMFKHLKGNLHTVGVVVWGLLAVGFACLCRYTWDFSARGTLIHVAALFGTAMAANVWMRIWPAQQRIMTATKNGEAPDPADPALAGLRSKHNTYMSFSLLLFMVSVHQGVILGVESIEYAVLGVLGVGWVLCWACYKHSASIKGW